MIIAPGIGDNVDGLEELSLGIVDSDRSTVRLCGPSRMTDGFPCLIGRSKPPFAPTGPGVPPFFEPTLMRVGLGLGCRCDS